MKYSIAEIESFAARFYNAAKLLITPDAYTTTFLALAQAASATNVITVASNGDFILLGISHRAQIGAAQTVSTKTAPYVRVLLTDSGSGEQFTNAAVDLENYSSNRNEHDLVYPRIIQGRSTITVAVTNYAPTAETYTSLDIVLEGVRVRALG
jgi:hypothetical protein